MNINRVVLKKQVWLSLGQNRIGPRETDLHSIVVRLLRRWTDGVGECCYTRGNYYMKSCGAVVAKLAGQSPPKKALHPYTKSQLCEAAVRLLLSFPLLPQVLPK